MKKKNRELQVGRFHQAIRQKSARTPTVGRFERFGELRRD
jgi:hypothetical protein